MLFMFQKTSQLFVALALASRSRAALFYPNAEASLIEHILVDTHGAHSSGFADAITPCTNYVSGNQNFGRETAAQWLRVAFHDFVTARVDEGTGGLDASIGFETLREEDSGSAFNDSFAFFRPYVNARVSMADLVALSVTMSVGNCGGPQIPVRTGRVDATAAGPFGVPAPETSLDLTLQYFANAGFNQVDSIGLTACGHTLGSVHHGGFPTVVGPEAVTPNNTAGGIHFDNTVAAFDSAVVSEYLSCTGGRGGPLVTSFNISSRSDLRLYESDNNATMISLAAHGADFLNTCSNLLQRMVETVPAGVVLSNILEPIIIKPINVTLDASYDGSGSWFVTGSIRILSSAAASAPHSIQFSSTSTPKTLALTAEPILGSSVFGSTSFYPFSIPIADPATFSAFTITNQGSSVTFPVQSAALIIPSMTSVITNTPTTTLNVTIAVAASANAAGSAAAVPTVKVQAPVGQMGTLGPAIWSSDALALTKEWSVGGYDFWQGSVDVGSTVTGRSMVVILDESGQEVDVAFF